jgi:hypothetical protein
METVNLLVFFDLFGSACPGGVEVECRVLDCNGVFRGVGNFVLDMQLFL